jgi:glycosyltransferase involved in cell wall biosynthesis
MEELYEKFKFDKNKVDYVYNPLTYSEYANINLIKQKRHQVLFVGRQIEYHKRMSYFLKAWKLLSCTHDISDWNLIILGEGPDEDLVRETIKKFNIPNCTPVGFHAPLDYYKESALLLLTSYIEGWGMVIPEGMQNGVVPIVTDSFSAAHAIIKDGHDGLIVENNNIPLYAESIWRLISNASLREQMAINAIESSKKFEISAIADKWLKIFNELKVN